MPVLNPVLVKAVLILLGVSVVLSPIPSQYQQGGEIIAVEIEGIGNSYYEVIMPVDDNESFLTFINKKEGQEEPWWEPGEGTYFIDKDGKKVKEYQEDGFRYPIEPWKSWDDFYNSLTVKEKDAIKRFNQKCENMEQLQLELKKSSIKSKVQKQWFKK